MPRWKAFTSTLHRLVAQHTQIECAYVLDEAGRQISDTFFGSTAGVCAASQMFKPAVVGTDHSLKEYFYVLLGVKLNKYTTEPYVSMASGNLCRTIATLFRDSSNTRLFVLCVDVNAPRL